MISPLLTTQLVSKNCSCVNYNFMKFGWIVHRLIKILSWNVIKWDLFFIIVLLVVNTLLLLVLQRLDSVGQKSYQQQISCHQMNFSAYPHISVLFSFWLSPAVKLDSLFLAFTAKYLDIILKFSDYFFFDFCLNRLLGILTNFFFFFFSSEYFFFFFSFNFIIKLTVNNDNSKLFLHWI